MLRECAMHIMAANGSIDHEVTLLAPVYLFSTIVCDFGDKKVASEISRVCNN